jgi:hypothetical protein
MLHLVFSHWLEQRVAAGAPLKRRELMGEVKPPHDLDDLVPGAILPNPVPVGDLRAFEETAITGQQDALVIA